MRRIKVMSELVARRVLQPYEDRLNQAVSRGVNEFLSFKLSNPPFAQTLTPRSEASITNDKIIAEVRASFLGDNTVSVGKHYGLPMLNIQGRIAIRFKKLDQTCRSSNYDTEQQRLLRSGEPLPGLEDEARLIVGYRLDSLGIALRDVVVTHPVGRDLAWSYVIGRAEESTLFMTPTDPVPTPLPKPKVVPKQEQEKKKAAQ